MSEYLSLQAIEQVQSFALRVAISGVCICAAVLITARLLRHRSHPLRYGILFAGIIGLLALPVLVGAGYGVPASVWDTDTAEDEIIKVPLESLPDLLHSQPNPIEGSPEVPSMIAPVLGAGLVGLWTLGTAIGLVRLLRALWKQTRIFAGAPWCADFWTDDLKAQLAQKLGLRTFPPVHVSPITPMPMVLGLWRPRIVLPEQAHASWKQAQWEAILLHEGAHIARRDPWAVLAQRVAVMLFWWCPLVYLITRRLNELRENICDDYALEGPCDQLGYVELLVASAERLIDLKSVPIPLALLDSARGGLEARVMRLLDKERKPMTRLSLAGKLLGAGFLVAACLVTTAATALSQGQTQPARKVQIKIIIDGKEIDLSDLKLLEAIETVQRLPTDKPTKSAKAVPGGDTAKEKGAAFVGESILVTSDGKMLTIIDARTGKILHQIDQSKATAEDVRFAYKRLVYVKPDPRIEELVKQAEAIKPGSGAEIRKALQGAAKPDMHWAPVPRDLPVVPGQKINKTPEAGIRLWDVKDGKKIIILSVEGGKVVQLTEQDLKKLLDAPRFLLGSDARKHPPETKKPMAPKGPLTVPTPAAPGIAPVPTAPALPPGPSRAPNTKGPGIGVGAKGPLTAPAPAANEMESLRRQLERITAELHDLRKRLDASKK